MSATITTLLKEMEEQAAITRTFLERVPEDKFEWQPHTKSMSMIRLAAHVAELPSWVSMSLTTDELDFEANPYTPEPINNVNDLIRYFERSYESGHAELQKANEAELEKTWTLRNGSEIYSVSTKQEVIRMAYNQLVHHRAQLGVYFRLLDIPVPASFGPSADSPHF